MLLLAGSSGLALPADASRLRNISTRGEVLTGNDVMISGFIIGGSVSKTVVVNVAGPSLANYGITNGLADPMLTLVRSSDNQVIGFNDNWQSAANAAQMQAAGLQPNHPLEPSIMMTLAPGAYTAIAQGVGGGTGVGLVGVFAVDHPEVPLINISTRGPVLTGNDVMIAGFVIQGSGPQTVVITAAGPSLANFGIDDPLVNPTLTLVRSIDNVILATNDNWGNATNAEEIIDTGFAPSDSRESAILATLEPGGYTAIVSGIGNTTGTGLVAVWASPIAPLAGANASSVHYGFLGETYAYYLPKNPSGLYGTGFLQQGDTPGTPSALTVEWAISKTPGDFDYYKSAAAMISGQTPCGGVNGAVGGSYYWSLAGSFSECKVDNDQVWYINVRYLNNCPIGVECPVSYFHSESR